MGVEWVGAIGAITAAVVTGLFNLVRKTVRENTNQHAANQAKLEAIGTDVIEVKGDVREVRSAQRRHLEWHAEVA
jgi:hypothetical protein